MPYDTLEDARTDWEGNVETIGVWQVDEEQQTTTVLVDEINGKYGAVRYWKNTNGKWVVSVDHTQTDLSTVIRYIVEHTQTVCGYDRELKEISGGDQ